MEDVAISTTTIALLVLAAFGAGLVFAAAFVGVVAGMTYLQAAAASGVAATSPVVAGSQLDAASISRAATQTVNRGMRPPITNETAYKTWVELQGTISEEVMPEYSIWMMQQWGQAAAGAAGGAV